MKNEEAARVYMTVRRQIITMFDREIDLNYAAVCAVMDLFGIRNKQDCFQKVVKTYHHFLKEGT